jgi:hypothetical protein
MYVKPGMREFGVPETYAQTSEAPRPRARGKRLGEAMEEDDGGEGEEDDGGNEEEDGGEDEEDDGGEAEEDD